MTHRFPIKEIARQSGLGLATIDRVLNNRANVSPQTRARVQAALGELKAQEQQLSARGRRMFVDVVVEAPARFSRQIQSATEMILPMLGQAVFRPRFLLQQVMTDVEIRDALRRIQKRGSSGVLLKARDVPVVREIVDALETAGIPVVTLVTDVQNTRRTGYVGMDNTKAGQVAAYLLSSVLEGDERRILTVRSQTEFQGEAVRFESFKKAINQLRPRFQLLEITGGAGLSGDTKRQLERHLVGADKIDAVYSMGGGNRAILDFLQSEHIYPQHYVAHDLDQENVALLQERKISFVLHHDLKLDMHHAFEALLMYHGLLPARETVQFSDIQIITPHNLPATV